MEAVLHLTAAVISSVVRPLSADSTVWDWKVSWTLASLHECSVSDLPRELFWPDIKRQVWWGQSTGTAFICHFCITVCVWDPFNGWWIFEVSVLLQFSNLNISSLSRFLQVRENLQPFGTKGVRKRLRGCVSVSSRTFETISFWFRITKG